MDSDLKLVGNQVRVEACDLVVDAAERRKAASGQRRALVHDFNDGLTVNWADDYPGGVTINGAHTITGVRSIHKQDGWVAPIAIDGGVAVANGILHVTGGGHAVFSDATPADDFVSGEIFQDDEGLHVAGSPPTKQTKPVVLQAPIARKTVDFGSGTESVVVAARARQAGRSGVVTLAAGPLHENARIARPRLAGSLPVEFDLVDTLVQLMSEVTELRARVKALEGA